MRNIFVKSFAPQIQFFWLVSQLKILNSNINYKNNNKQQSWNHNIEKTVSETNHINNRKKYQYQYDLIMRKQV